MEQLKGKQQTTKALRARNVYFVPRKSDEKWGEDGWKAKPMKHANTKKADTIESPQSCW